MAATALAATSLGLVGSPAGAATKAKGKVSKVKVPASLAAQAKKHPLAPYPSQKHLTSVTIGQSVPTMSFAPLQVAESMNFFGYLGLNVTYATLQSGTAMQEAVIGGTIDLGADASTDPAEGYAKGIDLQAIGDIMPMTLQLCVEKSWASQHHVSPSSTLTAKAKALKGATFGITGPGALSDAADRWFMKKYGKITPTTGITSVTVGSSSLAPSLSSGKIDAFFQSPPTCQEFAGAEALITPGQIPLFKNYANEVLFTSASYAKSHASILLRVATAVAMGDQFMKQEPTASILLLEKLYPTTSPTIIAGAFLKGILPSVTTTIKFTTSMWENVNKVLVTGGSIPSPISTKPTAMWTNKYISFAKVF